MQYRVQKALDRALSQTFGARKYSVDRGVIGDGIHMIEHIKAHFQQNDRIGLGTLSHQFSDNVFIIYVAFQDAVNKPRHKGIRA